MGMDRQIEKKKWTPKKIAVAASAVLFVVFFVYVFFFKFRISTLNVEKERITISTVTKGPFQEFIPIMGNVLPLNTVFITATEGGRVEERFREAGAMVKKGDPILRLSNGQLLLDVMWREGDFIRQSNDLRSTRLQMEQFQLRLQQDMANDENLLQQQKRTFLRYGELIKDNLISRHEYELAQDQYNYLKKRKELNEESQKKEMAIRQTQLDALEAALKRMEGNLAIARERLDNLTVKAPVSGYLTALDAEIGQSKGQGQPLGQVDILEGYRVRAAIDENYLIRVQAGKTGEFDISGKAYQLVVKKVYPEVREGRFEVDLEFTGEVPPGITRGQTLHIKLDLGGISDAVLLATGGFFQTTGGNWVYVVDKSGKSAVKRNVKFGRYNPQVYEVLEGLEPGEQVITSSYEMFGNIERLVFK